MGRSSSKLALLSSCAVVALGACAAPVGDDRAASGAEASTSIASIDAAAVLEFVNYPETTAALLDAAVGLDARAAKGIVAARDGADGMYPSSDDAPFATLAALDRVPYVGSSALAKLQAYALAHPAPAGETVEGVAFSGWQSVAVAWGVNHATVAELDALLDARAAKGLVAARPFASIASMGPVAYVGAKALGALRDHAAAWWAAAMAPPAACVASFESAVSPHLADLLFMSESDRPFDVVAFPGAGASAPTAASVLALVGAPAGSTAQIRATSDYDAAFEPASATADPNAAADVEQVFAGLADVTYVAVFAPAGSANQALVDVYLVGRTTCGDLVGIHAIAVET